MNGYLSRRMPHEYCAPAKRYHFRGQWLTVSQIAAERGISPAAVRHRASRGLPFDAVLRAGREAKLLLFRGQMMTAEQIASLAGIHQSTVYKRTIGGRVLEGMELRDPHRDFRSTSTLYTYRGHTDDTAGWARRTGIHYQTLRNRLKRGWPISRAVSQAPQKRTVRMIRRLIKRISIGFRRARNRQLIHRIASAFRLSNGGYVETFTSSSGTGGGSIAPERGHFGAEKTVRKLS